VGSATKDERENQRPITGRSEAPAEGNDGQTKNDHDNCGQDRDDERDTESLDNTRDFNEEVRALYLLLSRAPLDVVAEEVGE
jgi:hypothetical protein